MGVKTEDFPYEEIRQSSGDYFEHRDQLIALGYDEDQIWSATECDDVITYGPGHHWINLLGYFATKERHDGNTYYEDEIEYD